MLESRRRAYLHALGIPLYHPRQQLSGALPSAMLASVPSAHATAAAAAAVKPADVPLPGPTNMPAPRPSQRPVQGPVQGPAQTRPAAQAALAQLQAVATPATAAKAVSPSIPSVPPGRVAEREEREAARPATPVESADMQGEAAAFAFAFIPVNEQIAVINELPRAGSPTLTPASRQLLAGILKALTLPGEERNLSSQSFVWPSPDLPPTEQGPAPARELLKGFLARRFSIRPVRYLLVLAEQGAPYLFPAGFAITEGQLIQHPDFDVQVLATRSLGAMEAVPALKREVWSAVQPLLGALQGSQDGAQERQNPDRRQDP